MNFQQLTYLIEVSNSGSINKAAQKLMMSQSGISTALRDLEEELGIQFFERSSRGVRFTPAGKEFLGYAVSLIEHKERIESLYSDSHMMKEAEFFSVSSQRYPFTEDAFLRLIRDYKEDKYQLSIKETDMDTVVADVYNHRADIGILFLSDATEKIVKKLLETREVEFHELITISPCIYVRKGHPLEKLARFTMDDLANYPYLSFEQVQGVSADFSEEYPLPTLKKPLQSFVVNSRATALHVMQATDAFTTGSGLLVKGLSVDGIVTLPIPGDGTIKLGYILNQGQEPSEICNKFIGFLNDAIKDAVAYTETIRK